MTECHVCGEEIVGEAYDIETGPVCSKGCELFAKGDAP